VYILCSDVELLAIAEYLRQHLLGRFYSCGLGSVLSCDLIGALDNYIPNNGELSGKN